MQGRARRATQLFSLLVLGRGASAVAGAAGASPLALAQLRGGEGPAAEHAARGLSLLRAEHELGELKERYAKELWMWEYLHNKTGRCRWKREYYAGKAAEARAMQDQRRRFRGRHAVLNRTELEERRRTGNRSLLGLWTATDEPQTKREREAERWSRSLKLNKLANTLQNATALEEGSRKYARYEEEYRAREAFKLDELAGINSSIAEKLRVVAQGRAAAAEERAARRAQRAQRLEAKARERQA